jgi:hypothetical protein
MPRRRIESRSTKNPALAEKILLRNVLANEAIERLTRWGVPKDELIRRVLAIPHASNKVVPLVPGVEERRLRKVPDQIDALARTIQQINESPWVGLDRVRILAKIKHRESLPAPLDLTVTPEWVEVTVKRLAQVPSALQFYARHLRALLDVYCPTGERRRAWGFPRSGFRIQTYLKLELLSFVRYSTGKSHYVEVAKLLDAAFSASDRPTNIDGDGLKKLEKNNTWLAIVAHNSVFRTKE